MSNNRNSLADSAGAPRVRVAVITPFGSGGSYSGPTLFIDRLVRASHSSIAFVLLYAKRSPEDTGFSSAPSQRLMTTGSRSLSNQLSWAARATWWTLRHAPDHDVVHLHGTQTYNLIPAVGAYVRGTNVLLVPLGEHELSERSLTNRLGPLRWARRSLIRRASGALAISRGIASHLERAGLDPEKIVSFGNPVSESFFAQRTDEDRFRRRHIIFLGGLSPRKQPHLIVEALAQLRDEGITATASFYGPFSDDDYRGHFETTITRLGIQENVRHMGYVEETAALLTTEATALVLPSREEGLPGALVEALAAGVPPVVTDVGAMGDTVRAAGAGFVVDSTPHAIAEALRILLTDDARWSEMSRRAQAFATEHFSAARVAQRYHAIVSGLPDRPNRRTENDAD